MHVPLALIGVGEVLGTGRYWPSVMANSVECTWFIGLTLLHERCIYRSIFRLISQRLLLSCMAPAWSSFGFIGTAYKYRKGLYVEL